LTFTSSNALIFIKILIKLKIK